MLASGHKIHLKNEKLDKSADRAIGQEAEMGKGLNYFDHKSEVIEEHNRKTGSRSFRWVQYRAASGFPGNESPFLINDSILRKTTCKCRSQIIRGGVTPGPGSSLWGRLGGNWSEISVRGCKGDGLDLHVQAGR